MTVNIEKALDLIYANVEATSLNIVAIEESLGLVLAQDLVATHNLPPYDNSAMDGFAVRLEDEGESVLVEETIFAGDAKEYSLENARAYKIMTGAKVPYKTQCIVPIEDVIVEGNRVQLPKNLVQNRHIRFAGEDIQKGSLVLARGERIDAHKITILASQGISHIKVHKRPRIAFFASGDELKMHFERLGTHQLYNTNTPTLLARAKELGCEVAFIGTAKDTLEDIKVHIKSALEYDLIVTSGGVSVGDADFTKEAFEAFSYDVFFDKIDIKPGKPTIFGKIAKSYVINLPGNPMAAAINFELFAQSILLSLSGAKRKYLAPIYAKMKTEYAPHTKRVSLVPGYFDGEYFEICEKFAPGMVSPLSYANAYMILDKGISLKKGESVKLLSTKFSFVSDARGDLIN